MRKEFRATVAFVCGCVFTVTMLTRCGMPGAVGGMIDGGVAMLRDAGLLPDGGSIVEMTPADAVTQSGSRLKAKFWKSTDGAQVFTGMYDTQLQTDCSFVMAPDGTTRCLPETAASGLFFSDAACTHPLAYAQLCSTPSYVLKTLAPVGCAMPQPPTLSTIGQKVLPTQLFSTSGSGSGVVCSSAGASLSTYVSVYSFWEVGQPVASSMFAQATLTTD